MIRAASVLVLFLVSCGSPAPREASGPPSTPRTEANPAPLADNGENWPQWRGPFLNGTAAAKGLPVSWSETKNVKWKTKLPSWSGSTPAIWGDKIFVMSAGEGKDAPLQRSLGRLRLRKEGRDLLLLCYSKKNGKEIWRVKLSDDNYQIGKQNMSSPSPITDGRMVWALTGNGRLTALDMDGKKIWRVDLQEKYGAFGLNWGYGSSPLLYEDRLIIPVLHGMKTDDPSYLVALHPKTGKVLWKVERETDAEHEGPDAYTTPIPMKYKDRTEIIISGGDYVTGHDPATGKEIWRCGGFNPRSDRYYRTVSSPAVVGNIVVACVKKGPTVAVRGGGKGNVTKTHSAWTSKIAYDVPTPVSDGTYLYVLSDRGMMTCFQPETGKTKYDRKRLPRGIYDASPLLADGKIYVTNEMGRTTVLAAGPKFKILSENQLNDKYTLASIAVSGSELFIRTSTHLYCIGEQEY